MWPRHTLGMPWSERPPAWRRHSRPPSRASSGVRRPHAGLPTAARVVNGPQEGTHSALDAAPMHAPRTVGARARPFPLPRHRSTPARLHPPAGPLPPWGMRGSGAVEQGPRLATARLGAPPSRTPRRVRSWRETGIPATSGHGVDTPGAGGGSRFYVGEGAGGRFRERGNPMGPFFWWDGQMQARAGGSACACIEGVVHRWVRACQTRLIVGGGETSSFSS